MQSTIYFLQQELRKARESVTLLQQENTSLKSSSDQNLSNGLSPHTPPPKPDDETETSAKSDVNPIIHDTSDTKIGARTPPSIDDKSLIDKSLIDQSIINNDDDSSSDSAALIIKVDNEELTDREYDDDDEKLKKKKIRTKCGNANGDENKLRCRTTKRDKCDETASDDEIIDTRKKKKCDNLMDCNEPDDDTIVITNGETLPSDPE